MWEHLGWAYKLISQRLLVIFENCPGLINPSERVLLLACLRSRANRPTRMIHPAQLDKPNTPESQSIT